RFCLPCPCLLVQVQDKETGVSMIGLAEFSVVLAGYAPALIFWIVVIVFAAIWLRSGGGRAERLLIVGASLKLIDNLLGIPAVFIVPGLVDRGYSMNDAISWVSGYGIFCNIIGMAGIICLVYAFWLKFKTSNFDVVKATYQKETEGVAEQ
ncbi:hypothetical protein ACFLU7_01275, partial [Chloroflexota bacterium]